MIQSALMLIFPVAMAFAAATDLLTFKIPNRISVALVAAFLVAAPFSGLTWVGFFSHVATFAVVLALGIALFTAGLFGGGDAKLLAAAALWIGYESLPVYMAMVAIWGGALAVALILFRQSNCRRASFSGNGSPACTAGRPACPMALHSLRPRSGYIRRPSYSPISSSDRGIPCQWRLADTATAGRLATSRGRPKSLQQLT